MANKHTLGELQQMQSLSLNAKIAMTRTRIKAWVNEYGEDGVYVSFSGGKDSTVLLHIAREMYPDMKAVFVNTGLEYPEIVQFVKTFPNVDIIRPKMNFRQVIEKYGYPFISKEVSECVYGARKYLTSIMNDADSLPTDRPTDRIVIDGNALWESENIAHVRMGETHRNRQICRKTSIGGGEKSDNLEEPQRCSSELINSVISTVGTDKAIDNLRVQRLLGINRMDGKATLETIPEGKDRSMFSCKRYQFFLDAPPEIRISNMCCNVMKKAPANEYAKKTGRMPITAQMASESRLRTQVWLKQGCNAFDANHPISNPMAFWFENDVLEYIYRNNIEICSVYGEVVKENEVKGQLDWDDLGIFDIGKPVFKTTGCERTGCVFCGYGCHREKSPSRFERLHITHPKLYNYVMRPWSEGGLGYKEVIDWINEHGNLDIRY